MSNEIREKDHEWVKAFHSNFDRLLTLLENLLEKRQPSAYGDELLTDKEVAYLLKVSRRYVWILIFLEGAQLTACPFYLCF